MIKTTPMPMSFATWTTHCLPNLCKWPVITNAKKMFRVPPFLNIIIAKETAVIVAAAIGNGNARNPDHLPHTKNRK